MRIHVYFKNLIKIKINFPVCFCGFVKLAYELRAKIKYNEGTVEEEVECTGLW